MTVAVVLRVLVGALAVGQIWLSMRSVMTVLRPIRVGVRRSFGMYFVLAVAVAVSPIGEWIPRAWERLPILTGLLGGLLLVALTLLVQWATTRIGGLPRLWVWVDGLMMWVSRLFTHPTPILLAVALHGATQPVIVAAGVLGVARTARTVHNVYVQHSPGQRVGEISYALVVLPQISAREREVILRDWLRRAVLRRPRHPDFILIFGICEWALATSQSRPWRGQSLEIRRELFSGWQPLVQKILDLAATEALPRTDGPRHATLERALFNTRYWFINTQSRILENEDYREEAVSALRELVTLAESSNDQRLVSVAQAAVAGYEGTRLGLVEESATTLAAMLRSEDLSVELRSIILLPAITVSAIKGDEDTAEQYIAELEANTRAMRSRPPLTLAAILKHQAPITISTARDILATQASPAATQSAGRT